MLTFKKQKAEIVLVTTILNTRLTHFLHQTQPFKEQNQIRINDLLIPFIDWDIMDSVNNLTDQVTVEYFS